MKKMTSAVLKDGFRQAELITRRWAKTFYFASRFLNSEQRRASYAVYAICRICDESVDGNDNGSDSGKLLEAVRGKIAAVYDTAPLDDPLLLAFQTTIVTYQIPRRYFDELLAGMAMDLSARRYGSFNELFLYCYRVAGVVGLMMARIFGCRSPQADKSAIDLGVAMQLTNIVRDVAEDLQRDRIYIPLEDMKICAISEEDIKNRVTSEALTSLIKLQIRRAREFYARAEDGLSSIPQARSRLVVRVMKNLYEGILDKVEENGHQVFSGRACLHWSEKIRRTAFIIFNKAQR